ncbi:MAG: hypothetical protein JST89_21895 [Cyanobacteria bacterium SZAS-4]|nr:hypothetical protein [Cyanobacteria bacterium SZAS-4]
MQDVVRSILDDFQLEGLHPVGLFDPPSPNVDEIPAPTISFSPPQPDYQASQAEIDWFNDLLSRARAFSCQNSQ